MPCRLLKSVCSSAANTFGQTSLLQHLSLTTIHHQFECISGHASDSWLKQNQASQLPYWQVSIPAAGASPVMLKPDETSECLVTYKGFKILLCNSLWPCKTLVSWRKSQKNNCRKTWPLLSFRFPKFPQNFPYLDLPDRAVALTTHCVCSASTTCVVCWACDCHRQY